MIGRLKGAAFRHDPPRQPGSPAGGPDRFPLFDSLRAIAAISVVVYHLGLVGGFRYAPDFGRALPYVAHLDVGVTMFFVISGFLLYRPWIVAHVHGKPLLDTGAYAWRRFLRIVPAYWVALTVIALWLGRDALLPGHALTYYVFGQVYSRHTVNGGLFQTWSLCVEVLFYASLPLWARILRAARAHTAEARLRLEWQGLAWLVILSVVFNLVVAPVHESGQLVARAWAVDALPRFLDWFAVGMALAVASVQYQGRPLPPALRPLDRFPGLGLLLAAIAFWAVHRVGQGATAGAQYNERHYLYALVALGLVAPATLGNQRRGLTRRALGNGVLLWIGLLSYAVFLWHWAVMDQLDRWGTPAAVADATGLPTIFVLIALTFGGVLLIAWLSWILIERPALRLKHDLPWRDRSRQRDIAVVGVGALAVLALALSARDFGPREAVLAVSAVAALLLLTHPVRDWISGRGLPFEQALLAVGIAVCIFAVIRVGSAAAGAGDKAPRHYVAMTDDGLRLTLYIDGRAAGSTEAPGQPDAGQGPLQIGAFLNSAGWRGTIDEVAAYRRALGPGEITSHFLSGDGRNGSYATLVKEAAGLAGYWRLDGEPNSPVVNAIGGRSGSSVPDGLRWRVPGLLRGDPDPAVHFDGAGGSLQVPAPNDTSRGITLEAWVTAEGKGLRHLVTRTSAYAIKNGDDGRLHADVLIGGQDHDVSANWTTGGPTRSGRRSSVLTLVAAIAVLAGGVDAVRRRSRSRAARPTAA